MFVSQAIASIISSVFLIIGASVLLLSINWKLGDRRAGRASDHRRDVLGRARKVRKLFIKGQEAIDWLNKVINESILGSALIRLLNSQQYEYEKFLAANTEARDISLSILRLFASLIPVIMFCDQPGDADDSDAGRPFRDSGLDDASATSRRSTAIWRS